MSSAGTGLPSGDVRIHGEYWSVTGPPSDMGRIAIPPASTIQSNLISSETPWHVAKFIWARPPSVVVEVLGMRVHSPLAAVPPDPSPPSRIHLCYHAFP